MVPCMLQSVIMPTVADTKLVLATKMSRGVSRHLQNDSPTPSAPIPLESATALPDR
jgi:hypothetical protein